MQNSRKCNTELGPIYGGFTVLSNVLIIIVDKNLSLLQNFYFQNYILKYVKSPNIEPVQSNLIIYSLTFINVILRDFIVDRSHNWLSFLCWKLKHIPETRNYQTEYLPYKDSNIVVVNANSFPIVSFFIAFIRPYRYYKEHYTADIILTGNKKVQWITGLYLH